MSPHLQFDLNMRAMWMEDQPEPQIKSRHPVPFDYIWRVDPRDAHLFLPLQLKTRESTLALIPL